MDTSTTPLIVSKIDDPLASDPTPIASANGVAEIAEPSNLSEHLDLSLSQRRDSESLLQQAFIRSEECRQLFHLSAEEVLIQDFNCALQENFLLQGHMYLFIHHICFYSNLFGFETKKVIPFHEVTCVRKAKTAVIIPNAIEIIAGDKKHFFASFLSRDEAYRLIVDGWSHHNSSAKALIESQETKSDSTSQESMLVLFERSKSSKCPTGDSSSGERTSKCPTSESSSGEWSKVEEDGKGLSNCEDDPTSSTKLSEIHENGEDVSDNSSHREPLTYKMEDVDAPKVPEYYTMVAESKFQIRVEEFFNLFFSDKAVGFVETFHRRCKDKDLQCTSWVKHEQFGHIRDVSFQHPIKLYFGAKFGQCQEVQKFWVYRNSHLVIETSQQINDVPYGDHFRVEGLWDVEQMGENNHWCILRVYIYVTFSKKTIWKGKIEQSTIDECREAYGLWINSAHELIKKKQKQNHVEREGVANDAANPVQNKSGLESSTDLKQSSEGAQTLETVSRTCDNNDTSLQLLSHATPILSILGEYYASVCAYFKSQSHMPLILVIAFISILILTQLSVVVLLSRSPIIYLISQENSMSLASDKTEAVAWLDKRVLHLKEEMLMVETRLEKMHHEYSMLKTHIQGLEQLKKKS